MQELLCLPALKKAREINICYRLKLSCAALLTVFCNWLWPRRPRHHNSLRRSRYSKRRGYRSQNGCWSPVVVMVELSAGLPQKNTPSRTSDAGVCAKASLMAVVVRIANVKTKRNTRMKGVPLVVFIGRSSFRLQYFCDSGKGQNASICILHCL